MQDEAQKPKILDAVAEPFNFGDELYKTWNTIRRLRPYELRVTALAPDGMVLYRDKETLDPIPAVGDKILVQNVQRIVRDRLFEPYNAPAGYPGQLRVTLVVAADPNDLAFQEQREA